MASLKILLTDAAGEDLKDRVLVDLFSMHSSTHLQASAKIDGSLQVNDIDISSGPFYRVMVTPANYLMTQAVVSLSPNKVAKFSAAVAVDRGKVQGISAPVFSRLPDAAKAMLSQAQVPRFTDGAGGFLQGAALYGELDRLPLLKACLLNIAAKAASIPVPDGKRVADHILGLVRIEQDRLFVGVTAALVEEVSHSNSFHPADSSLHEPVPGYQIISSFKTFDHFGNLQLTFQRKGNTGIDYLVDVDIDDAQGFEHIFQVVRNSITGPTNPYEIHDVLLQQKPAVDPGYEFVFATAAAVA